MMTTRLASLASILLLFTACGGDDSGGADTEGDSADSGTSAEDDASSAPQESLGSTSGPGTTGEDTGTTDTPETTGETGEDPPPCEAVGFSPEASAWTLPDLSALPVEAPDLIERVGGDWACTNDQELRFSPLDLDGDGQLDFVITDGCDADGVGTERWIVHPGEGSGFGDPATWTLPDLSALPVDVPDIAERVGGDWSCTNDEELRFTIMDLTGDGRVDFVITDGCDAGGVGAERWIVHPGEDGGFGGATMWTLPDLSALPVEVQDLAERVGGDWSCTNDQELRFSLLELTGDDLLDLVITDGCDADGVGTERWIVHPGEPGGFGAATPWTLPDLSALPVEASDLAERVGGDWGCTNDQEFRFTVADLTADGRADFVITDGCDAGGVGTERWIVHPGGDGGFGAATTWTLPDLSALPVDASDLAERLGGDWGCSNEQELRFTSMDVTGDGVLDFVITDGCDGEGVGTERWIVHPGADGGFGEASTWSLPDLSALPVDATDVTERVSGDWGCNNDQELRFTTMDLTGNQLLDFVITDGCDNDGVGAERWISHAAVCE